MGHIQEGIYKSSILRRHLKGELWKRMYMASFLVAFLALVLLVLTIVNETFGYVLIEYRVQPETVSERPLEELNAEELVGVLQAQVPGQLIPLAAQYLANNMDVQTFADTPIAESMAGKNFPEAYGATTPRELSREDRPLVMGQLLAGNLSSEQLYVIVEEVVLEPDVVETYPLFEGLFNREAIEAKIAEEYPDTATRPELQFHSWLNAAIFNSTAGDNPLTSGIRTALLGSLYVLVIVVLFGFPLGIMTAIYLEEYAGKHWLNNLIENNIRNLAGVPSIVYGMLGLQLFVRALEPVTSGAAFGVLDSNGRTILSAGLTMALLVLPVVIINAQEAIRAVPNSYREASYGLGATKWQTIWNQVIPAALPGILTGTILSISRAIGETAPLIIVGAATYIAQDPTGFFSKFTALPIQIFSWTTRPQPGFKELAAAAIVVLLLLLVVLNLSAFVLRHQARRRLQA
ncbi:MAG: phosphate ABC transporter permease PstA [Anaerolineae bacterium]